MDTFWVEVKGADLRDQRGAEFHSAARAIRAAESTWAARVRLPRIWEVRVWSPEGTVIWSRRARAAERRRR